MNSPSLLMYSLLIVVFPLLYILHISYIPRTQPLISKDSITTMNSTSTPLTQPWKSFSKTEKETRIKELTLFQYDVTQKNGTERPFANEYHATKDVGIYVDIVSKEPLFYSKDKYDSGTGWPSFVRPIDESYVTLHKEDGIFSGRVEVRSSIADSHLGHVFDDGPTDRGGKRYCMNSAALLFIPKDRMVEEGYGEFIKDLQ